MLSSTLLPLGPALFWRLKECLPEVVVSSGRNKAILAVLLQTWCSSPRALGTCLLIIEKAADTRPPPCRQSFAGRPQATQNTLTKQTMLSTQTHTYPHSHNFNGLSHERCALQSCIYA